MSTLDTVAQITYSLTNIILEAAQDLQKLQVVKDDPESLEDFYAELRTRGGNIAEGLRKPIDGG